MNWRLSGSSYLCIYTALPAAALQPRSLLQRQQHAPKSTSLAEVRSPSGPAIVVSVWPQRGPGLAPTMGKARTCVGRRSWQSAPASIEGQCTHSELWKWPADCRRRRQRSGWRRRAGGWPCPAPAGEVASPVLGIMPRGAGCWLGGRGEGQRPPPVIAASPQRSRLRAAYPCRPSNALGSAATPTHPRGGSHWQVVRCVHTGGGRCALRGAASRLHGRLEPGELGPLPSRASKHHSKRPECLRPCLTSVRVIDQPQKLGAIATGAGKHGLCPPAAAAATAA